MSTDKSGKAHPFRAKDALMRRLCMAVVWLYLIACVLALALIPATGYGLFGIEPNPFVALYAVVLGVPWSFLSAWLTGDVGVAGSMALIAARAWRSTWRCCGSSAGVSANTNGPTA